MEEAELPRTGRGARLAEIAREDLDLYAVEELDERIGLLKAEITRAEAAKAKKLSVRQAADALFSKSTSSEDF